MNGGAGGTAARLASLRRCAVLVKQKPAIAIVIRMANLDNQYPQSDKIDFQIIGFAN